MPNNQPLTATLASVARHATLREQNLRVVIDAIIGAEEPVSRAEVAASTGLSRAAVSGLVDLLVSSGVIDELPPVTGGSAGRPKLGLIPAGRTLLGLGLEVHKDRIGACLMDLQGEIIAVREEAGSFGNSDPVEVLAELGVLARSLIGEAEAAGMRVVSGRLALPGLVNSHTGLLAVAATLGWRGIYPLPMLGLKDLKISVSNNSKLAAWMEGYVTRIETFAYVLTGIGIGGAIIVDRTAFEALQGWNAEIGHVVVNPDGPMCECGSRGCLEQYVGVPALARALGLPAGSGVPEILTVVSEGDPRALQVMDDAATAFGAALGDFVNLVGIPTIVIGGELVPLLPFMQARIEEVLRSRALGSSYLSIAVLPSEVSEHAVLKGAARAAVRDVLNNPTGWA